MGKKEEGLGRALVKHHNQMVRLSKEKGHQLGLHNRRVLESVTDVADIDAVIEQAEASNLTADNPVVPNLLVDTDSDSVASEMTPEERRQQQKEEEALHASSLRVPRRPPWNAKMTVEELEENERRVFFSWRRSLARLEENEKLVLTPFEKNLDIWRQLWRVLERSDLVVMVVDARDPLFYRCPDLEAYAQEIDGHKRIMLLVNKADLLPMTLRNKWAEYFHLHGILFLFWSAKAASAALEGRKLSESENFWVKQEHESVDSETKIHGRDELLARLQFEAEAIAEKRKIGLDLKSRGSVSSVNESSCFMDENLSLSKHVTIGFVGYPNVGKSSTINALVGQKRTGVTSTPGKTKHFQTLIISDKLVLCDCPGLVFPSFSSSRYEMVASGVLPIDRMTEHREAVQVVTNRVTRHALESIYNITLPKPKPYEPQDRPPLASELLRVYCASRGYVGSSGLPDETRAARLILKDYLDGKLPHFEMPPGMPLEEGNGEMDSTNDDEQQPADVSDEDDDDDQIGESFASVSGVEPLLDDLKLFDNASENGPGTAKKKAASARGAAHKHHKKPQRKKDRSWRVQNDDGDGMPVVRVFQKQPVKLETMVA